MGFNAGEVTATLSLDRDAFHRSLEEARQEVERFEKGGGTRTERVEVTGIEEAKARLATLSERKAASFGVNTREARAEITAVEHELDRLRKGVEAHVGVEGVPKTLAEIDMVLRELRKVDRKRVEPKVDGNALTRLGAMAQKASGSMGALGLAALALGPAIVPVAAVATAGIGGLASGLGAAAIGAGSFGMVLKTQLSGISAFSKRIEEAQMKVNATFGPAFVKQHAAAVKQLELLNRQLTDRFGPGAIAAVHSWQKMQGALKNFQQSFNPQITSLIVAGTHTITTGLKLLKPVTAAAGNAFVTLTRMAGTALQSPFWKSFFGWLAREAGPAIVSLGRIIGNLAHGFAGLMMAFTPMSHGIMNGLVGMTAKFARWATHLGSSGGFHKFIASVRQNGPLVLRTLGDLARLFGTLARVFGTAGPNILKFVDSVAKLANAFLKAHPAAAGMIAQFAGIALISRRLLGPLGGLIKKVGEFRKWGGIARVVRALGTAFLFLRSPLLAASLIFSKVMNVVDKLGPVFSKVWGLKLGPVFARVAGGVTLAGAAIGVVIAGIVAGGIWMLGHYDLLRKKLFAFFHWISAKWGDLYGYLKRVTHDVVAFITGRWNSLMGYLKGMIGGAWDWIKNAVHNAHEWIKHAVHAAWEWVKNAVHDAHEWIKRAIHNAWEWVKRTVHDAWEGIKRAVKDGVDAVLKWVEALPGKFLGFLEGLPGKLFELGKHIIQGLLDGIGSLLGKLGHAAAGIANTLTFGLSGKLGIKSPSTVFHGFGVNIMQGLRNGIHTATPLVIAALRSVTAQMQSHMKGALAAFADRRAHRQIVALDRSPQSRELAALTGARDAEAAVVQQNQDAQSLMAARMTDDPAQVAAAQHQIDARKRDERIAALTQELADKRTAISNEAASAKAGHDAQANSFVAMLGHQTAALEKALVQRHISLARFSEQIRRLFGPLGMTPLALTGGQSHALGHFAPADRPRPRLGHGGHRPAAGHTVEHHNYQVNVPPAVAGQHGFDARHASAQLGQALVRHGRHGRRR